MTCSRSPWFILTIALLPLLALAANAAASEDTSNADGLVEAFRVPSDAVKPWAYWWWLKGNVTEQSITRDLDQMKEKGFGGLLLFDARGYHEAHVQPPPSRMDFMSAEWRRLVKFATSEAHRLGLEMSINLSSCAGALKGPWNVGKDSPKQLIWTSTELQGPKTWTGSPSRPKTGHFRQIAVVAARHAAPKPDATSTEAKPAAEGRFAEKWKGIHRKLKATPTIVEVVDLTSRMDDQGQLTWNVPEGRWTVLCFGCVTMEGHEFDVDILDADAVEGHFQRMGKALLEDAGPWAVKTLTHFYSVSWEGAIPTWTIGFDRHFNKYRRYNPIAYLPVLAGMTVESPEVSRRFLRDYYKTLGDCFRDHFYGKLHALCRREGVKWHSESGGPWGRRLPTFSSADQMTFLGRNDMPQGEFWYRPGAPPKEMNRQPAMAAHIYGNRLAATEAFTHMVRHWSAYPAMLKPDADAAFCDGVNQFVWHTFTASPPEFGKPGIEYFAGTHINPNITWWEQAGPLLTYLARCQLLLREGRFVGDVCCYTGDAQYMHWGRGEKWSEKPTLVLGKGYTYDLINTEVLLDRLSVDQGDLVLPDGMRYRLLVVDLEHDFIRPEALRKIVELTEAGATVVLGRRKPRRAVGLQNYPASDEEVRRLADALWGKSGQPPRCRQLGKGQAMAGVTMDEALRARAILPDFEGPFHYTHRRADGVELYFLAGEGSAECVFRVDGKEPELWNPVTGTTRDAVEWRSTDDGRTVVPISLPKNGSVFVVFREPARSDHLVSVTGPKDGLEIVGRAADVVRLRLWQQGRYVLETSRGGKRDIQVDAMPEPVSLVGPWQVHFKPAVGEARSVVFDKLTRWDTHPDEYLKHFSGTATYKKTFTLDAARAKDLVRLQLGSVKHVAEVRLNGTPLGVIWTAPWIADLTGTAKPGENVLEIDVTNLWVNRLIGDAGLPPEKRLTGTNILLQKKAAKLRPYKGYTSKDPLEPSGLLGPVRIEFGRRRSMAF